MDCDYCYLKRKDFHSSGFVSLELVLRLVEELAEYNAKRGKNNNVVITFHGGEPLLVGHDFFERIFSYEKDIESKLSNIVFRNNVQTNLVLLDENYCELFKGNNVSIGVSLDGPAHLHNAHRFSVNCGDTHAIIIDNIRLARSYGLDIGAVCIITRDKLDYAREIFDFFVENNINFKTNNIFVSEGCYPLTAEYAPSTIEYAYFLVELFDIWFNEKPRIVVENLMELLLTVIGTTKFGSCAQSNCAVKHLTVTPTGECYICGRMTGEDYFLLGDFDSRTLEEIAIDPKTSFFLDRVPDNIPGCKDCEFKNPCNAGCMYDAFLNCGTVYAKDMHCEAFKIIYRHILTEVRRGLGKFTI